MSRARTAPPTEAAAEGEIDREQLVSFVERVERLHEERADLADDLKQVFAEIKASGYDPKTVKAVVRIRKAGEEEWEEASERVDIYLRALKAPQP